MGARGFENLLFASTTNFSRHTASIRSSSFKGKRGAGLKISLFIITQMHIHIQLGIRPQVSRIVKLYHLGSSGLMPPHAWSWLAGRGRPSQDADAARRCAGAAARPSDKNPKVRIPTGPRYLPPPIPASPAPAAPAARCQWHCARWHGRPAVASGERPDGYPSRQRRPRGRIDGGSARTR